MDGDNSLKMPPPSLADVWRHCPTLTRERLHDVPDDQLLVFWAQRASIAGTKSLQEGKVPAMWSTHVVDKEGKLVGHYLKPDQLTVQPEDPGPHEFICLAAEKGPANYRSKYVMEVRRRNGIWERVDVVSIFETKWDAAEKTTELIVLG